MRKMCIRDSQSALGILHIFTAARDGHTGNYAMFDQMAALCWVRDNKPIGPRR